MSVGNSTGSGQMMQLRKMDGSGGGKRAGGNGMSDVMQGLSEEDRQTLSTELQSLTPEQKAAAKEQMKSVDKSSMAQTDYLQSLLEVISSQKSGATVTSGAIYA